MTGTPTAGPVDYILIPIGGPHMINARERGGTLLAIFFPAGLQEMFKALGNLPADSLRDPAVRREISQHYDSTPV